MSFKRGDRAQAASYSCPVGSAQRCLPLRGVFLPGLGPETKNILQKLKYVKDDETIRLLYTSIGKRFSLNLKQIPIAWRDGSWGERGLLSSK